MVATTPFTNKSVFFQKQKDIFFKIWPTQNIYILYGNVDDFKNFLSILYQNHAKLFQTFAQDFDYEDISQFASSGTINHVEIDTAESIQIYKNNHLDSPLKLLECFFDLNYIFM